MGLAPLELVTAHPWQRAAFTTYALSLSFFESVLLDALVRGGGREAVILADIKGVRAALSEQGARRVGKDYEVEPVAVTTGFFHPKISALTAGDECHLLVGSGNLTFGGWGANFEVLEHLHPSFAADAIDDAAGFFDQLSSNDRIRHGAEALCRTIASDLRASVRGRARKGDIRLLHSLDGAISRKFQQIVQDLGGAVRLVVASPFWDDGAAIDGLCSAIGLDHVFVHAHAGGTVEGTVGSNWPARTNCAVHAVRLDLMKEERPRRLHAKIFEVSCKRGRLLLSGSANITSAALDTGRNVEACVARIQRARTVGWKFSKSIPLELRTTTDEDPDEAETNSGILRAVLEGDQIAGQVLTPRMSGAISVFQLTTEGPAELGTTSLSADSTFRISTPSLEVESWKSGRLVLRVQSADGRYAEGFVSVAAFAEITRRAGAMGPRLLAVLTGTEMPSDVAAIMSWFYEDPRRLLGATPVKVTNSTGDNGDEESGPGPTIAVAELNSTHAVPLNRNIGINGGGSVSWSRFMDFVFAAFRERRGPFGSTAAGHKGDDDQDDDFAQAKDTEDATPVDPAIERSLTVFRRLFDLLLSPENAPRHAATAFDLAQYICERLQPDIANAANWLDRLIDVLIGIDPPDRRGDIVAAILTSLGAHPEPSDYRIARVRFLKLGVPISGEVPSADRARGFQSVLLQAESFADMWTRLQAVRTFPEQAKAYLADLEKGRPSIDYVDLAREAPEEWPVLQEAFTSEDSRERIIVLDRWATACPRHHMTLPTGEIQKLRATSIATAKNCCQRILIYRGN